METGEGPGGVRRLGSRTQTLDHLASLSLSGIWVVADENVLATLMTVER